MRGYIIRRLLLLIPTLFFFSTIVFIAVRFLPGDIVSIMLSKYRTAGFDRDQIARQLGVDVPIHVQYVRWISGILLHADFGRSLDNQRPVTEKIFPRSIPTLELGFVALLVSLLFGLPIGIYSALRQDTAGDYITRSISILFISTPEFFIAILVMIYPVLWFGWAPSVTMIRWSEDPLGHLVMILVPGTVLGLLISGMTMRMIRTMMLEVLRQDYIRTAWAKGLRERVVVVRHALKKRLNPGHHRCGHPNTLDGRRGGDHRDRFRPSRAGHVDDRFHLFPGLSRGVRHQHDSRHLPGAGEFSGGHRIRLARSQDTL